MAIRLCRTSGVALKSLIVLLCGCQMTSLEDLLFVSTLIKNEPILEAEIYAANGIDGAALTPYIARHGCFARYNSTRKEDRIYALPGPSSDPFLLTNPSLASPPHSHHLPLPDTESVLALTLTSLCHTTACSTK